MAAAAGGGGGYGADNNNSDTLPAPIMLQCVMLGGVDSGKSTLLGTMLVEAGGVDARYVARHAREAEELGKNSFHRAFLVDRLKEERERGITISPTTGGHLVPAGGNLGLEQPLVVRNTPGHHDFMKSLLRQCVAADVGILVLPFDNSFPQRLTNSQPQLVAARALGVEELVVALVGEDSSGLYGGEPRTVTELEAKYADCMDELDKVLRRCGFDKCMRSIADLRDADADGGAWGTPVVVCSGLFGVHVGAEDEVGHTAAGQCAAQLHAFWSMAPRPYANLAAALNRPNLGARSRLGRCPRVGDIPLESMPLRAVVTDVYRIGGIGCVASLRVLQGTVRASTSDGGAAPTTMPYRMLGAKRPMYYSDSSRPAPEGEEAFVRSIECFFSPHGEAGPNSVVGVCLPRLRGYSSSTKWKVMAEAHSGCACVNEFVATVMVVEPPPGAKRDGYFFEPNGGPLLTAAAAAAVSPHREHDAFREGSEWPALVGVAQVLCRVKRIDKVVCRSSEKRAGRVAAEQGMKAAAGKGRWAVPGTSAQVVFEPKEPLAAEAFVDCPTLGRVVMFVRHMVVCFGRIESVTYGAEGVRMPGGTTKAARKAG